MQEPRLEFKNPESHLCNTADDHYWKTHTEHINSTKLKHIRLSLTLFANWNRSRKPKLPSPYVMLFLAVLFCPLLEKTQKREPGQCCSLINLMKINEAKNLLWKGNERIRASERKIQDGRFSRSSGLLDWSCWNSLSANNGFNFCASNGILLKIAV